MTTLRTSSLALLMLVLVALMITAPAPAAAQSGGQFYGCNSSGCYYMSTTNLGTWWVATGQSPAEALYYSMGGGGCVDYAIAYALSHEFPNDPFVDFIRYARSGERCAENTSFTDESN